MNEPQLSAEMEKRFDDEFVFIETNNDEGGHYDYPSLNTSSPNEIKHFLATALEEQRMQTEVKTGLNAFGVTMEEIAKARADERQKVLSEVEEWINQLPDWQWRVTKEALVAKLNQLKGTE